MFENPSDEVIEKILSSAKTIAVVGLSDQPNRPSYGVAHYLQQQGYKIIPVNPNAEEVLGVPAVPSLSALDEVVDIIDVFRNSAALEGVVRESLGLSAPTIWAQLGVHDETAAQLALAHGKTIIMDKCLKVEHARLVRR
ncbi:CoA-binding protein [Alicyclobacillus fastidiosus]|uniref:CoA-binding protein n=1 Tax=Alicyclobacillus fastidiosus TaxID=392011 RepID=A0ABV5AHP5_9BACL|nr:CoA-binding protein [Alicyclobacillus fastidiosus]WEH08158.1 CoA-binding protein [Alicyclobacillus fastidiosus]